ncbi:MAG TPA: sigma 54-interacting transcriptional regulator [Symbiobacteriaceae bacterium]
MATLEYSVTVRHPHGLHARAAAELVKMAVEAAAESGVRILFRHGDRTVPAENFFALVSLRVPKGDTVTLLCHPDGSGQKPGQTAAAEQAMARMARFLAEGSSDAATGDTEEVDEILHEATVTLDRVLEHIPTGLLVVNDRGQILLLNPAAERYLGIQAESVLGRQVDEVIPAVRLSRVLQTGESEVGRLKGANQMTLVISRTPIWSNGRVIGAAAILQDISDLERVAGELREVKALKEQLNLVLDAVGEGICVVDPDGTVRYTNPAFLKLFGDPPRWSPDGPVARTLRTGQPTLGQVEIAPNGARIVVDVYVIRLDGEVQSAVAVGRSADVVRELARRVEQEEARAEYLAQELIRARPLAPAFSRLVGNSGTFRDALAIAAKAAPTPATILIRGESGTGKELVAEAIHLASPRARGPFVRLNCAAIPPTLVESELFGHEKGAFTGATRRRLGKFELANGGTIFLDEIGALDLTLQAKLLRVLQNREVERVGGDEPIPIDVRVIAATNANLEEMVARGQFREDLYYRLNVIGIYLPPLRERRGDIPLLVEHFIAKLNQRLGKKVQGITPEALRLMTAYDWPGNVRQLENVVERAVTLCEGPLITVADLPAYLHQPTAPTNLVNTTPEGEIAPLEEYEREIIRLALERYGSFNKAARALGVTHRTVALKARKYGLVPDKG